MQFLRDLVNDLELPGRFGNLLKNDEELDHIEQEASLYKRDILRIMAIFKDEKSDEDDVIDALDRVAHAIYLGGSQSAKLGLSLLPKIVNLIRSSSSSTALKVQSLKTLSEICTQYKDYQNKVAEFGGLALLMDMATESGNDDLSNWSFYCLTVLVANNIPLMRDLQKIDNIQSRIHRSMHHYSKGQKIYAEVLLRLLGLDTAYSH